MTTNTVTISREDANRLRGLTVAIEAKTQELLAALTRHDTKAAADAESDRLVLFRQLALRTREVLQ